jgi:hypothetical protein
MHQAAKLESLEFAAAMLKKIRLRTEASGEDLLIYLLDMATIEAEERIKAIAHAAQRTS